MKTDPNPQGKGLVPILNDVASSRPKIDIRPKKIDQIAGELFTSMFVLESEFAFKPVVGSEYYLYQKDGRFRLSLISPDEWAGELFGRFIGRCVLEQDITWTLEMDERASDDQTLIQFIHEKQLAFETAMESADQLGDMLPVYCASLPYYQRLFASALASSLGLSMELSGIKQMTYSEAKVMLE